MADPKNRRNAIDSMISATQPMTVDYRAQGASGLKRFGGFVFDDQDPNLRGQRGARVFREMGDNDSTCGTIIHLMNQVVAGVNWYSQPASNRPEDQEASDFLQSCLDDMETSFQDVIVENMSMAQYGFSLHEIIYKRRCGKAEERWMRSKHSDGRIGWRGLPIRAQDTIYRWGFAEDGSIDWVEQQPPPSNHTLRLPMEKCLLFRTSARFNNPEGQSMLRRAHRAWKMMSGIEAIEGVGVERDLAGLPYAEIPMELMLASATAEQKALYQEIKDIVTRTRRDEQEGIVFPSAYDEQGNKLFEFKLMTTGGTRQFDTGKIIDRYKGDIARSALAAFLMLGQGASAQGSWAMHSDMTKMFIQSLNAFLYQIKQVYNRFAIPRLFELNTFRVTTLPQLEHTPLEAVDMKDLSEALRNLTQAGMPIFPNSDAEKRIMEVLGLPTPADPDRVAREAAEPTMATNNGEPVKEIRGDAPAGLDSESQTAPAPSLTGVTG